MTDTSLAKTQQDQKTTVSGYGFTAEISTNGTSVLFDATGKEIVDVSERAQAYTTLFLPLIQALQQETAILQQASTIITSLSVGLEAGLMPPANKNKPEIGQLMLDGTVYGGLSATTGTRMYVMPEDSNIMNWYQAVKFTQSLSNQYGYNGSRQATAGKLRNPDNDDGGWRLPTQDELIQLYDNKNDIGGFRGGSKSCYWSSSVDSYKNVVFVQRFDDGEKDFCPRGLCYHVRCVRTEPRLKL